MRIFFDIILVLSALTLPFPMTLFLACVGFFLYPRYVEAVVVAVLIQLLYQGGERDMFGGYLPLAAFALIMLLFVEVMRTFIRERAI